MNFISNALTWEASVCCGVLGDLSHSTKFNQISSVEILVVLRFQLSGQLMLNITSALEIL